MRRFFLSLLFAASGAAAIAADLPARTAAPPPPLLVQGPSGWGGFYAGVHAGYSSAIKSSLTTTANSSVSKSIGRGECLDSNGGAVSPPVGANPNNCTAPTNVPNTFVFTPSAPYTSSFVAGTSATCVGGNGGNQGACERNGGRWQPATSDVCTATSGPNSGTTYTANSSDACARKVGSSPDVCTATSGANKGTTYDANSSDACARQVGSTSVPSTNTWATGSDLFSGSAMAAVNRTLNERSPLFGVNFGYNFQTGSIVMGVEADLTYMPNGVNALSSRSVANVENADGPGQSEIPLYANMSTTASGQFGVRGFATLRARLGYDFNDKLLVFVTGGPAIGDVRMRGQVAYEGNWGVKNNERGSFYEVDRFSKSGHKLGYAVGGGLNYKLSDSFILGLTYLYVNLGKYAASSDFAYSGTFSQGNNNPNAPNNGFSAQTSGSSQASIRAAFHTVRLSAQYRFASETAAPVLARY